MNRLLNTAVLILFSCLMSFSQTWYKANNPFGGRILQIHETSDGILLCGTTQGLYKSWDYGDHWQSISGGEDAFAFLDVQSTPSGMYVSLFYNGIRRSYDAGQTWQPVTSDDWTSLNIIVVKDSFLFVNTNNSVWRSTNDGDSWSKLTIDNNVNSLTTLELSPDGELFAGTYNKKIYRSSNNGDTWTHIYSPTNDARSFAFYGNDIVYAATSFSGLYKSIDNGDNWTMLPALSGTNGAFDINANSSGEVFAAAYDGGILKSTNGGTSWTDITSDLISESVRTIFLSSSDELFLGTGAAGVTKLTGSSWVPKNEGIAGIFIDRFISIDGILYACSSYGVYVSSDGGKTWQQSVKGMDDTEIYSLAKAPNGDLYAGGEMLYHSTDGMNWNNISQGFPGSEVYANDLLVEASGRLIVASDEYGIRYSDNKGQSWTNANAGLEDVTMTFIRKSANGYLFTADGYNLYRSNDLTGTWEKINDGLADTDIEEFAVGNNALFAITYSDGLFKSTDNGDNWTLATDQDFNNIAINGNEVYGSSERVIGGGVFVSDDNGANWTNIVGDLPNVQIKEVHYVDGLGLFTNVREFGLYTLDFQVSGLRELSQDDQELICYPNPFTTNTTIKLEVNERFDVQIRIFDLLGKTIEPRINVTLQEGTNMVVVGDNLPRGMYYLEVVMGNSRHSVRVVKTN